MATKNINGTYTSTYVLTSANPSIYFEPTNSILTTNQTGVYGAAGTLWSVSNAGVIGISGVTHHSAVSLKGGGSITNDKGGEITAFGTYAFATYLGGAGTVSNAGTLGAYGTHVAGILAEASATTTNTGTIYAKTGSTGMRAAGVDLAAGGSFKNSGGAVNAYGSYISGVEVNGGGSVTNYAKINAYVDSRGHGSAVEFVASGGSLTNETAGQIYASGSHVSGVYSAFSVTVTNSGSISVKTGSSGSHGTGVNLNGGGSLTNNKGATVYGYGSYVSAVYLKGSGVSADNSGTIKAVSNTSGHVAGVNIAISSGILHNETTGTISASGYHTAAINATVGGTVYNYGSVDDSGAHGNGVYFVSGGSLTNSSLITETGGDAGVWAASGASIHNKSNGHISGKIAGVVTASDNLLAANAGTSLTLTNDANASVMGDTGVFLNGANGSIVNAGAITGTTAVYPIAVGNTTHLGDGVFFGQTDDSLNNESNATISGARYGVYASASGADETVTNAGSITGVDGSIKFTGGGVNQLTLETGSSLSGVVIGSAVAGATNKLTLEGTGSAGNQISNFTSLDVTSAAVWTLSASSTITSATIEGSLTTAIDSAFTLNAGSTLDLTAGNSDAVTFNGGATLQTTNLFTGDISGATSADKVNITNLTDATVTNQQVEGALTVVTVDGTVNGSGFEQQLNFVGTSFGAFTASADAVSGTDINVPCFARGTRIRTLRGEIAVEQLQVGDRVVTASGARPVVWIGHRAIDCRRYADPKTVQPIRVAASAFAVDEPSRELWLSPGHSVAVDGVLIPVGFLVNGHSIDRVAADTVEYWHVELDAHDILFAEGLAAESYLDCGNRSDFVNGGAFVAARPDFLAKHWRATCLPLVLEGPEIAKTKQMLLDRLAAQGVEATRDADARILADGRRIAPILVGESRLAFVIPAGCESIVLKSRTFIPAYSEPGNDDRRELGVCVSRLSVDGDNRALENGTRGWLEAEREDGRVVRRWTNGEAELPAGARVVVVDLVSHATYLRRSEDTRLTRSA